ncbi:MAG TPA: hypothetical protein PLG31_05930 [Spirochaetota bacterium]|nr:hypothetical protein [Spirochaetota bacterium]
MLRLIMILSLSLLAQPAAQAAVRTGTYHEVIAKTSGMVGNGMAQGLARKHGLGILNVTWEDTGRYKGSSVGPNISDMTIQVQTKDPETGRFSLSCMPVIRHPNFSDESADISPDRFFLLVGNEKSKPLRRITLKEYLSNMRKYLTDPGSWKGRAQSLLAKRDTHVLVSAQACFLPVPKKGIAEFNPVLFNYQSYGDDPAVLAILATREGASATVIDNKRDAFQAGHTWGQRLFFNKSGKRASLTGKRMSDFISEVGTNGGTNTTVDAAGQNGLNMVLLIQVPLKQRRPMRYKMMDSAGCGMMKSPPSAARRSDVESAVIGHGTVEGPFTEIGGIPIERDERFPIRVTVQFYKATSNGVVSEADMREIAGQLKRVYAEGDYAGSLVVAGTTGRPTEYDGDKIEPPDWWESFWRRHTENTGQTPEEAIRMLKKLYGPTWQPRSEKQFTRELKRAERLRRFKLL